MSGRPTRYAGEQAFHVSQMRDRVTIQQATETISAIGQPVRTWAALYTNYPAKWMPVAGQETVRGRSVEAGVSTVFTIRYQTGITPEMRVVHSSGTYGIVHAKQIEGRQRYIELHCKKVA
jgi:SPP1 family predicted phage head-tail adaptor